MIIDQTARYSLNNEFSSYNPNKVLNKYIESLDTYPLIIYKDDKTISIKQLIKATEINKLVRQRLLSFIEVHIYNVVNANQSCKDLKSFYKLTHKYSYKS